MQQSNTKNSQCKERATITSIYFLYIYLVHLLNVMNFNIINRESLCDEFIYLSNNCRYVHDCLRKYTSLFKVEASFIDLNDPTNFYRQSITILIRVLVFSNKDQNYKLIHVNLF